MESKVTENGQAKAMNTEQPDKTQKFIAGKPINTMAVGAEQENEAIAQKAAVTKADFFKLEIKAIPAAQSSASNLEHTLKKIKELHRYSIQREKLIETIWKLEDFEIRQLDEAEETQLNHFQRCELRVTDDNGHVFTTRNPFIIEHVAKNIKSLCSEKLTVVEAQISLNL